MCFIVCVTDTLSDLVTLTPEGGEVTGKKMRGWWSQFHRGSTAPILAPLQASGGQLGDGGRQPDDVGGELAVMVSGCHRDWWMWWVIEVLTWSEETRLRIFSAFSGFFFSLWCQVIA